MEWVEGTNLVLNGAALALLWRAVHLLNEAKGVVDELRNAQQRSRDRGDSA